MNEQKFLDSPPDHSFEPTCEFKWIRIDGTPGVLIDYGSAEAPRFFVLCQRFQGTFKDCWVRIPVE